MYRFSREDDVIDLRPKKSEQ